MNAARMLVLALLFGCLVTSAAMATKPSMRPIKNLFVKHGAGFKQWGLSIVAACTLATAGCGNPGLLVRAATVGIGGVVLGGVVEEVRTRHDHPGHISIDEQGGVRWHVHTTSAYEQHGRHQHKGLINSLAQRENYLEKSHTLTPSAYHEVTVLFDDDGVFRYGLATGGESDDTIVILFPYSKKHQTIQISQIVGVQYMHTVKQKVYVTRQDIHPFGYAPGMYESDPSDFHNLVIYGGDLKKSFTNGMGIVDIAFDKRALAEVDQKFSAPAR